MDVVEPLALSEVDRTIVGKVDAFLSSSTKNEFPVATVANTIFPQAVYEEHGAPDFYRVYNEKIFPRLKRSSQDWGRYFERLTAFPHPKGGTVNLLDGLVNKMRRNVEGDRPYKNIYELPIYDPIRDANASPRGRQCLSYLSFKLDNRQRLLLTAVYRNHYYTEKLLGNLVGLGHLMAFVAQEAGVGIGPLTVLSTHATVDVGEGSRADLSLLLGRCRKIASGQLATG
jgi:thymidylate synthase